MRRLVILLLSLGLVLFLPGAIRLTASVVSSHLKADVLSNSVLQARTVLESALDIGNQRQLFIDDYIIGSKKGLERVFHSPERHPANPIIVGDQPWEQWVIEVNGRAVVYDDKAGEFRMYYLAPEMDPSAPYGERFRACLATSRDGVNWTRPNLGQLEWQGSRRNNLLRYGENWMRRPNVFLDPSDPDPARRYKMTYVDFIDGQTAIAKGFSENGIEWRLNADGKPWFRKRHNSNLLGWDPRIKGYVLYLRMEGGPPNTIGRSTSGDLINWSDPLTVLAPNPSEKDRNFTALAAFLYEGLYLGLLSVSEGARNLRVAELVSSRDGIDWQRVTPGKAYLPRGGPDSWDSDAVIPVAPVIYKDRIWIYYTGWNLPYSKAALSRAHKGWFENGKRMQRAIGLGTLRLDGFASIQAGPDGGTVTTRPIKMTGSSLLLNAKVRGELRVEILGKGDQAIPGYTAADCKPLRADKLRHEVMWRKRSNLTPLSGKLVKLRVHLRDGNLYSFKLGSGLNTP